MNGETVVDSGTGERVSNQEYERMRRERAKVEVERDFLKKALAEPGTNYMPTCSTTKKGFTMHGADTRPSAISAQYRLKI